MQSIIPSPSFNAPGTSVSQQMAASPIRNTLEINIAEFKDHVTLTQLAAELVLICDVCSVCPHVIQV